MSQTYLIEPVDTWFFREARPFDVAGGNELASIFPPPARTVVSALHTLLNGATRECWIGPDAAQRTMLDTVKCRGPWLVRRKGEGWERLYPAPLDLFRQSDSPGYLRLNVPAVDKAVRCDLGNKVLLPELDKPGAEPVENAWLTATQMQAVLTGEKPTGALLEKAGVFKEEPRIGLARDNRRRAHADGMLFSTRHLRLRNDVALALEWGDETSPDWSEACVRFGGEGRLARINPVAGLPGLDKPKATGKERGLILMLLTPAQFRPINLPVSDEAEKKEPTTVPPGLQLKEVEQYATDGYTTWQGAMQFIRNGGWDTQDLILHCAVIGKAIREGGWRADRNRPRPVRNYLPAGSLWYCTLPNQTNDSLNEAIAKLHGAQIGEDSHFGRGELAVGLWK